MTYLEAENAIYNFLTDSLKKKYPGIYIITPNVKSREVEETHIKIYVNQSSALQMECGPKVNFRKFGLIFFSIRILRGTGTAKSAELTEYISDLCRGKILNGITFQPEEIDEGFETGNFYQVNMRIPYRYNVIHKIF